MVWNMIKAINKDLPERHSGVFIVTFKLISYSFGVSIVDFEQVNVEWDTWPHPS